MENGYTVSTEIPPGYSPDYHPFIFNRPDHLSLQGGDWVHFYLLRKISQKIIASVAFQIQKTIAKSPLRAPFGSFHFSERLSPEDLFEFVQRCESQLRKKGAKTIVLTEPPLFYRKTGELFHAILFNLDYRISCAELSSGIRIGREAFEQKIDSWEKRKLKQARSRGVRYKTIPIGKLEMVYGFLEKCREQKGHRLSMTLQELTDTVAQFNDAFILSGTFLQKELIAASIAIRVHPDILYNFYAGHMKKYDSISPMVTLTSGLYKFCAQNQIHLLDLGTSTINGKPNFGLLDFKLRLGAVPSMKLTFEKELL